MTVRDLFAVLILTAGLICANDCFARGGGGGRGGAGGGGARGGAGGAARGGGGGISGGGGGGFSGGAGQRGGFGGASAGPSGGFGGGGPQASGAGLGSAGGAGPRAGASQRPSTGGAAGLGSGGVRPGSQGGLGGAGSAPSRDQLSGFLGMPSDEGMPHGNPLNTDNTQGAAAGAAAAIRNQPQASGGQQAAAGAAAANRNLSQNPNAQYPNAQGAAAGAAAANRNSPSYSGAQGAAAMNRNSPQYSGAQGAAAGAAVANRNDPQFSGAQGAAAGYAAGFNRATPSARYGTATAVRANYNHYDLYRANWNVDHPGAWMAAGWGANNAWQAATWASAGVWCGCQTAQPVYYDYGTNITYQGDNVYMNGEDMGTTAQYYDQAASLASTGAAASAPSDGDWLPLGVFALSKDSQTKSEVALQLAVNKEGVVRGNSTDTVTNKVQTIQGSVDKQTQRLAFTVGDNTTNVVETGLYNLTKDEAPVIIHFGSERTEQWLMVRLKDNAAQ